MADTDALQRQLKEKDEELESLRAVRALMKPPLLCVCVCVCALVRIGFLSRALEANSVEQQMEMALANKNKELESLRRRLRDVEKELDESYDRCDTVGERADEAEVRRDCTLCLVACFGS